MRDKILHRYCVVGCLLIWSTTVTALLSLDEVRARIAEVENSRFDTTQKQQLVASYTQTQGFIQVQATNIAAAERFKKLLTKSPQVRKELGERIAELERSANVSPVTQRERTLDAAAIENLLETCRTERSTLEGRLSGYELRIRALHARPAEIAEAKAKAIERIATLEGGEAAGLDPKSDALADARRALVTSELSARQAEVEALTQEQLGYANHIENLGLKREQTVLALERLSARTAALEALLLERRQAQTENARDAAAAAAALNNDAAPVLRKFARENVDLSSELSTAVAAQAQAAQRRAEYADQRQQIAGELDAARQRLNIAASSASLGRILVDQRRRLPSLNNLRRESRTRAAEVSRISLRRIELDERLKTVHELLQDLPTYLQRESKNNPIPANSETALRALLQAQQGLVTNLDTNYAGSLRALGAADVELEQLISNVTAFTELLDQRLLWIPNATAVSMSAGSEIVAALREFILPLQWQLVGRDFVSGFRLGWLRVVSGLLVVVGLLRIRAPLHARLRAISELRAMHERHGRMRDIGTALFVTTVCALPLPVLSLLAAMTLHLAAEPSDLTLALAEVLNLVSRLGFVWAWWYEALRDDGLLVEPLACPVSEVELVRHRWRNVGLSFVPCYAAALGFEWTPNTSIEYGLRRMLFVVVMIVFVRFSYWLVRQRPTALPFQTVRQMRLRWLAMAVTVVPPIALSLLSLTGYHYTAVQLSKAYFASVLLAAGAIMSYALATLWLRNAEGRLRVVQALSGDADSADALHSDDELAKYNLQAVQILRNGLGWSFVLAMYWTWSGMLPALTVVDQFSLWNIEYKDAAGVVQTQATTISNVVAAVIITFITIAASRNLPGVLEIGLLQRLKINRGGRYAITSLLQYAIVAIGASLALSKIGLRWVQVQWLVAALGVGLGFGLQEIFANFISGLILLFERPIRVGDVVTIGDMSGKVTRIQIRATTLRDIDNKEMIVPNKTFITERFLNWTLSDHVTRLVIHIGVAYGTNTEQAARLLLSAAAEHPKVMKDPAPQVVFTAFGDSALQFELQVYAEELNHRADLRHELNSKIYQSFAAHGIDIPIPQREVWLHSKPGEPAELSSI